jgi:hypothetical protein
MNHVFRMVPASGKSLWMLGGIALLLVGLLLLFGYVATSSRHVRFEVSPEGLRIIGDLYGRIIPAKSLMVGQAKRLNLAERPEYQPRLRTNGTGLPGYQAGWFRLRNGDKALLFVTDSTRVVYVPTTAGYSVLLSVVEPDMFLQSLLDAVSVR